MSLQIHAVPFGTGDRVTCGWYSNFEGPYQAVGQLVNVKPSGHQSVICSAHHVHNLSLLCPSYKIRSPYFDWMYISWMLNWLTHVNMNVIHAQYRAKIKVSSYANDFTRSGNKRVIISLILDCLAFVLGVCTYIYDSLVAQRGLSSGELCSNNVGIMVMLIYIYSHFPCTRTLMTKILKFSVLIVNDSVTDRHEAHCCLLWWNKLF